MINQAAFGKYPRFFKSFDQFLFQWGTQQRRIAAASWFDTARCEGRLWHL